MGYKISTGQQESFAQLLETVDTSSLDDTIYHEGYLLHLLDHKSYYIKIYAQVLEHALNNVDQSPGQLQFVDYGAGNGLLGFFASFCGFRNVLLVDVDPSYTKSAAWLRDQISIPVDGIITGELPELKEFLGTEKPDIIAGTDVIEHIYDLFSFFKCIHELNPSMVTVFTTGSNPRNPFKVRWLQKAQNKDEYRGGAPVDYFLKGDQPAFRDIRRDIIRDLGVTDEKLLDTLADLTRGLRVKDIESAVKEFNQSGLLPTQPKHPTNTCHPFTGNWTERILEIEEYAEIYRESGFSMAVHSGFYNCDKVFPLSMLVRLVNAAIPFFNFRFSPFITLVGKCIDNR